MDGGGPHSPGRREERREEAEQRLVAATEALYAVAGAAAQAVTDAAQLIVQAHHAAGADVEASPAGLENMARAAVGLPPQPAHNVRFASGDAVVALVRAMAVHPGRPGSVLEEFRQAVVAAAHPAGAGQRSYGLVSRERICQITGLTVAAVRAIAGPVRRGRPGAARAGEGVPDG